MIENGIAEYFKDIGYKNIFEIGFSDDILINCKNINTYGGYEAIWKFIKSRYGNNIPLSIYQNEDTFKSVVEVIFLENQYKYKHLYETTTIEYDLLKPYHIEEEIVTGNKVSNETTTPSGSVSNNTSETSFDSLDAKLKETTTTNFNNQTEHSYENNVSENYKSEVMSGLTTSEKTKSTREGNIGNHVMADIIRKERDISDFSLWDVIAKDVIKYTCFSIQVF